MATKKKAAKKASTKGKSTAKGRAKRTHLLGDPIIINGGGGIVVKKRNKTTIVPGVTVVFDHNTFGPDYGGDCNKWSKENCTPVSFSVSESGVLIHPPFPFVLNDKLTIRCYFSAQKSSDITITSTTKNGVPVLTVKFERGDHKYVKDHHEAPNYQILGARINTNNPPEFTAIPATPPKLYTIEVATTP